MKDRATASTVSSSHATSSAAAANLPVAPAALHPSLANLPAVTTTEVEAFVAAIDTFAQILAAGFVVPQPLALKRMVKPRTAAPTIVPMVADLSTRYAVSSAAYPTDVTLAKQQIVNTLSPVAERIAAVQKLLGSVLSVGQSGAWEGAMVTYGLLKSEARGNAVLRNALAPVREKLRPTYETADGGKTKLRSRSKSATAKGAAPGKSPNGGGVASAPPPVAEVAPEATPAPAPAAPEPAPAAKA